MIRITKDPTLGALYSTCVVRVFSELLTRTTGRICCHNTDHHVHANEHDRTILVILTTYCTRLPDKGSFVI